MFSIRFTKEQNEKLKHFLDTAVFYDPAQGFSENDTEFLTSSDICKAADIEPNRRHAGVMGHLLSKLGHRSLLCRDRDSAVGKFYLVKRI